MCRICGKHAVDCLQESYIRVVETKAFLAQGESTYQGEGGFQREENGFITELSSLRLRRIIEAKPDYFLEISPDTFDIGL